MGCPWPERRHVLPTISTRFLVVTLFASTLVLWMSVLFAGGGETNPASVDDRSAEPASESLAKASPRPEITSDHDETPTFSPGDTGGDGGHLIAGRSFVLPRDTTGWPQPVRANTPATMSTATAALGSRAPPEAQGV